MASHAADHLDPTNYDGLGHHIASVQTYVAVFGSLLFFTFLTYAVSFANLGDYALLVAMMVAFVKAGLVATFFMHLKYDERFNVVVFLSSLFFIAVFFGFTLMDLGTRSVITTDESYMHWWNENGGLPQHRRGEAHGAGDHGGEAGHGEAAPEGEAHGDGAH
jgi:cytochrome c oxidase subunit 4